MLSVKSWLRARGMAQWVQHTIMIVMGLSPRTHIKTRCSSTVSVILVYLFRETEDGNMRKYPKLGSHS